jgi:hypothetical protein
MAGNWGPAAWSGGGGSKAVKWGPNTSGSSDAHKGGGGGFGKFAGRFGSDLLHAAENAPGGVYALAKAPVDDTINFVKHPLSPTKSHETLDVVKGAAKSTLDTFEHPGRHPGLFALNALALVSGGAGALARASAAADVARTGGTVGDAVKAAATKPEPAPRIFKVGDETAHLHPSKNPLVRAGQGAYDKRLKSAIANKPEGKVAAHAYKRIGGSLAETRRYQTAMKAAPAQQIGRAGEKLPKAQRQAMKDALRLTSEQTTPREAMKTAKREIAAGNSVETNKAWLQRLRDVKAGGYVKIDQTRPAGEQVHIDPVRFPHLADLDQKIAKGALKRDEALAKVGEMTPDQLQKRVNEPNLVHGGADYERPTPGKLGVPSQALLRARGRVDRLQALVDRAETRQTGPNLLPNYLGGAGDNVTVARLKAGLSVSKDELHRVESAAATRQKPVGFVGGNGARPGRNFVSYALTEPNGAAAAAARSPGAVVGGVKNLVPKQSFTGEGLRAGLVPQDTTGIVSRGMLRAIRRVDTEQFRSQLARMGADVKRTPSDVLVSTQEIKSAPIGDVDKALLGQKRLNFNEEVAHAANFRDWLEQAIPGHRDKFTSDKTHPLGAQAPEGYRWVPKQLLGELGQAPQFTDPGWLVRRLNDANAAVTTATVYVKPGHVLTRYGTNALANIIQGSATPRGVGMSVRLWQALSHDDRARALAAAGQAGFDALPHEGTTVFGRSATKGSRWWAEHADAPFRFNSIAFEARKAGFNTPAQFRDFLDKLENPEGLNAAQRAKVDYVARRANREAIAYDRLSPFEKQRLTTYFWFYPWTRAAINFAGNTLLEHPLKAAGIGYAGQVGAQRQEFELGQLPAYAAGLFKVGGSAAMPTVLNLNTATPFSTPAEVGQIAAHLVTAPKSSAQLASGMFNPALSGLGNLAYGLDQYGNAVKGSPIAAFARSLVAATPESGFATDVTADQSKRMYPTSGLLGAAEHFLTKPGGPRKLNRAVANAAAAKEAAGRGR